MDSAKYIGMAVHKEAISILSKSRAEFLFALVLLQIYQTVSSISCRPPGTPNVIAAARKTDTRREGQRESMPLRQSRRFRRPRSNSYSFGNPQEATVATRLSQKSRASLSAGESREVPFDSREEPGPRARTEQSSLPPRTFDLAEATSEQDWR